MFEMGRFSIQNDFVHHKNQCWLSTYLSNKPLVSSLAILIKKENPQFYTFNHLKIKCVDFFILFFLIDNFQFDNFNICYKVNSVDSQGWFPHQYQGHFEFWGFIFFKRFWNLNMPIRK
jgi:hypothetical protein